MERLERGDAEELDLGIPLRRTKGEVTAGKEKKIPRQQSREFRKYRNLT